MSKEERYVKSSVSETHLPLGVSMNRTLIFVPNMHIHMYMYIELYIPKRNLTDHPFSMVWRLGIRKLIDCLCRDGSNKPL